MEKAVALCLLLCPGVSASTVIVLWTSAAAVIGTDTKAQVNGVPTSGTCKIGVSDDNNILFAESGIRTFAAGDMSFDFLDILTTAVHSTNGITAGLNQARDATVAALNRVFKVPSMRDKALREPDKNGVQFVIIARAGDKFALHTREFFPVQNGEAIAIHTVSHDCPSDSMCKASGTVVGLGIHDHVDAELVKDSSLYSLLPQPLIHRLEDLEIAAHPDEVGLPLDIVQIDSAGIHRLEKGACK